ncbi:MAG: hypothetical protein IPN40_10360 [Uliginosibacterium sp.]|nr:hypothetical protein [Uliginosibacterium sp.]
MWQVQGDGTQYYLAIGGSPASIEHGINVFGSGDIKHCAAVMVRHARKALAAVLPDAELWQVRRVDVTHNYALPGPREVKQALRALLGADASRARASSMGGDTVGWNVGSDLRKGKAYHKGPQLAALIKKGRCEAAPYQVALCDKLLRLELTLGSRFWRRFEEKGLRWADLTEDELNAYHLDYFGRFFGSVEVTDMGQLLNQLEAVAVSPGQALAAHRTWALIKAIGRENAKGSMPRSTWSRHLKLLRDAGLSDTDLSSGEIIPFRRHVVQLHQPVTSWADLQQAA